MSTFLNSIFFIKKEHLNLTNVLNVLRDFMFTKIKQIAIITNSNLIIDDFLGKKNSIEDEREEICIVNEVIENRLVDDPVEIKETIYEKPKEELISPKQSDTLFWCLFIIHFGYDEYLEVDRNYGVKELEVKKCIGEYLTANQHVVKNSNIKITKACVQEILSELLTSQKDTSMNTLMAILFYYKINLIMVNSTRLLMLEFISDRDAELPYYVVYKDTYGKYSVRCDAVTSDELQEIRSKMICLESYLKPLKSIASYKVDELEDMAKKMGIYESNKKYKKTDLYQDISEACTWL
jgi:hypothetical protein